MTQKPTIEKFTINHYRWKCPECGIATSLQYEPKDSELTCWSCKRKLAVKNNQKRLEDLLLCAKVVKVESVYSSEPDDKIHYIKLLCSDDDTFVTIRVHDNRDEEDSYERIYMSFDTEKVNSKKNSK
jgi:hypothetical protein